MRLFIQVTKLLCYGVTSLQVADAKNVGSNMTSKTFVFEAGKVIIAISIILWVMASYGFNENFKNAESIVQQQLTGAYTEKNMKTN